jgi:L-cysteine desulfidase
MALEATKETGSTLVDIIDRILDKGLVINADIMVSVAGVELLGIKIRAALASFETAAKYGLEFPSGTNMETEAWKEIRAAEKNYPQGEKKVSTEKSIITGCL